MTNLDRTKLSAELKTYENSWLTRSSTSSPSKVFKENIRKTWEFSQISLSSRTVNQHRSCGTPCREIVVSLICLTSGYKTEEYMPVPKRWLQVEELWVCSSSRIGGRMLWSSATLKLLPTSFPKRKRITKYLRSCTVPTLKLKRLQLRKLLQKKKLVVVATRCLFILISSPTFSPATQMTGCSWSTPSLQIALTWLNLEGCTLTTRFTTLVSAWGF